MQPNNQNIPNVQPNPASTQPAAGANSGGGVKAKNPNSTQNSLRFSELRDDMVIMNDGTFRAVVAAQSINFDLMSSREREGTEMAYQDFLNSLNFPIQIYVRSEKVDIGPYLEKLTKYRMDQDNMLLGVLMDDYINFIDALSHEANIMDKSFFVIIPYQIGEEKMKLGESSSNKGLLARMFTSDDTRYQIKIPADKYSKAKDELNNRVTSVIGGLSQCRVNSVRLKTKELGELYYNVYNPDTAIREPIGDFRQYTNLAVTRGKGDAKVNLLGTMY